MSIKVFSNNGLALPKSNLQQDPANSVQAGSKPKILLLTQVLPFPTDAGPKIKTFNLIKYLSQQYAITLVSFVRGDNLPEHTTALLEYCQAVHTVPMHRSRQRDVLALLQSLVTGQPFLMVRDRVGEMYRLLDKLVQAEHFDLVQADQLNMAQYALPLSVPVRLLDQHNAVWTIADRLRCGERNPLKRLVLQLETFKLRRYEQRICRQFEAVLAVSSQDEAALGLPCHIVPIGVEVEGLEPLQLKPGSLNLVSLGTMFYPPNVEAALWFGQEIFPLILKQQPHATYTIIGAKPPETIYAMARQNPQIQVKGYVADLRPVLSDSAGLVVPLLSGGGMRVKILDALALGLPIVSTRIGAEGVELEHNHTALLADTPEEFAQACLQLLAADSPGLQLAQVGRQLALEKYDFRRAYAPLGQIYASLLTR
jgi:polysaccharide biosynthesis protein PslH